MKPRAWFVIVLSLPSAFASPPANQSQEGKRLFQLNCATGYCHGLDGRAGKGPRLRDRVWSKGYLRDTIANGIPGSSMPAWQGRLTDQEIQAVVTYIVSISKEQPDQADDRKPALTSSPAVSERVSLGKALFFNPENDRNCGVCHRLASVGGSVAPAFSSFANTTEHNLLTQITTQPTGGNNLKLSLKDGEVICGVKARENATFLQIYDLSSAGPPVLRTMALGSILKREPCAMLNVHQTNAQSYTSEELASIALFLKSTSALNARK